jgi:hypothetical protein
MNNGVRAHRADQRDDCRTIANVYFVMNEARVGLSEAIQVPTCIPDEPKNSARMLLSKP